MLVMGSVGAYAEPYAIDTEASLFAIITHKAGIASRLGHNHFIYPTEYKRATLDMDPADATTASLDLLLAVDTLIEADDETRERWYPNLEAAGILSEKFRPASETNREKIRKHMLAKKQLDAKSYPVIGASLQDVRPGAIQLGATTFNYIARVALTVHGETVVQDYPANITFDGDTVTIEATGSLNFTDFGIKPYSALVGAIRNQDAFDIYVNITGTKGPEEIP